jgi:hypothetical protein
MNTMGQLRRNRVGWSRGTDTDGHGRTRTATDSHGLPRLAGLMPHGRVVVARCGGGKKANGRFRDVSVPEVHPRDEPEGGFMAANGEALRCWSLSLCRCPCWAACVRASPCGAAVARGAAAGRGHAPLLAPMWIG